ncbi:LIM domain-binding protein 3, partial [Homalodisca vitripennis]
DSYYRKYLLLRRNDPRVTVVSMSLLYVVVLVDNCCCQHDVVLSIVNGGSLAEKAGLQVADAVIKVNGQDVYNLRHKDAQDAIVKAGNSFEVVVSRGPGGTWKPSVMPVGNVPAPSPVGGAPAPVTKTSLAYKGPASPAIGTGHNVAARPFSA